MGRYFASPLVSNCGREGREEDPGKEAKEAHVHAPPSRESPCAVGTHSITHQQASVLLSLSSSVRVQKFQTALREKPTTVPGLKDNTQREKMENAGICSSSCCSVRGEPRLVGLLTPRRRGAVKWRAVGYREPVRPPTDFLFFFLFFFSSGSGPPSLSGRAELCSEASQPFKVNSSPGDVLLSKGWGEGREGARSKLPLKWV